MSELERCPCCGGEATLCNYYFVQCKKCGISTLTFITKEEAIKAWNTRKPMERIVERLEVEKGAVVIDGRVIYQADYFIDIDKAIKIVKEEGGIDDNT